MTESIENPSRFIWVAGVAVGYALVFWGNPAHTAFRDGLRCARRYPAMAGTLGALGFWYAVAQEIARYRSGQVIEEAGGYTWWNGWNPPEALDCVTAGLLPAVEAATGLFNSLISTWPVSILAAVLLWFNWGNTRRTLGNALRKHYPRAGIWFLSFILLSSVCGVAKPILLLAYDRLLEQFPSWWTALGVDVVYRVAVLFEYTFAAFIQVALISTAYVWVRGITYDGESIRNFALHRLGAVMRWTLVLYAIAFILLDVPVMLKSFFPDFEFGTAVFIGRWILAATLLFLPVVQIRLVFHNENVGHCLRDQREFWKRHRGRFLWFILVAFLVFYPLAGLDHFVQTGLGMWSGAGIAWNLLYPFIWAPFAAWMLASWVCLFKQTESRKPGVDDWIVY